MADERVTVQCLPTEGGWRCEVEVGSDPGATRHEVRVERATLDDLAAASSPDALVEASFHFLLERESRDSILGSFELAEIGRYFPEYPDEIRRRLEA